MYSFKLWARISLGLCTITKHEVSYSINLEFKLIKSSCAQACNDAKALKLIQAHNKITRVLYTVHDTEPALAPLRSVGPTL